MLLYGCPNGEGLVLCRLKGESRVLRSFLRLLSLHLVNPNRERRTAGHCWVSVSRLAPAVRRYAGKQKDLGSIPPRLSFFFKKVVVCGHCLVTLCPSQLTKH